MKDIRLLTTEKNAVLEIVRSNAFSPTKLHWREESIGQHLENPDGKNVLVDANKCSVLHLEGSEFYFRFGLYWFDYSPGVRERVDVDMAKNREASLRAWLNAMKRELATPDLWSALLDNAPLQVSMNTTTLVDAAFSADERTVLARQLHEIQDHLLASGDFSRGQSALIQAQFEDLREASERLNKKDWKNAFVGVIFSLVVGLAMDPQKANGFIVSAVQTVEWIWKASAGLLQ